MNYFIILLFISGALACQRECKERKGSSFRRNTIQQIGSNRKHEGVTMDQLNSKLASLNAKYPRQQLELNEIRARINKTLHDVGSDEIKSRIAELLDGPLRTADVNDPEEFVGILSQAFTSSVLVLTGSVGPVIGPVISLLVDVMTSPQNGQLQQWSDIVESALATSRHMTYTEKIMGYYSQCKTVTLSLNGMELSTTPSIQKFQKLQGELPDKFGAQLHGELEGYIRNTLPTIKNAVEAQRLLEVINHYCYVYMWRINLLLRKYGLLRHMGYDGTAVRNIIRNLAGRRNIPLLEFLYKSATTRDEAIVTSVYFAKINSLFGITNFLSMFQINLPTIIPWEVQAVQNARDEYYHPESICVLDRCARYESGFRACTTFEQEDDVHGHAQYLLPFVGNKVAVTLVPFAGGYFAIAKAEEPDQFLSKCHGAAGVPGGGGAGVVKYAYACFQELQEPSPKSVELFALKLNN